MSLKTNEMARLTVEETTKAYWELLNRKYKLSQDKRDFHSINKRKLMENNYIFSDAILQRIGKSEDLILDLQDWNQLGSSNLGESILIRQYESNRKFFFLKFIKFVPFHFEIAQDGQA